MTDLFNRIGHFIHDHAGLMMIVTVVLTILVGLGLPRVTMNTDNSIFVSKSAKLSRDSTKYERHFGGSTYLIDVSNQGKRVTTPATLKKVARFTSAIDKEHGVHATTSVVDVLNASLKVQQANQGQQQANPQLQKAMMAQLSAKQHAKLQRQLGQALSATQQQQIAAYTKTLLTPDQQQTLATNPSAIADPTSITAVLTTVQQQQVQAYTLQQLSPLQRSQFAKQMLTMLPPVQSMSQALINQLVYRDQGKVPQQMRQLLPKNGKHLLITVTLNGDVNQNSFARYTRKINQQLTKAGLKQGSMNSEIDGMPAISASIMSLMSQSMAIMLVVGVLLMIGILLLVFQVRRRLLPLLFVLFGLIWTFGLMGWFGIELTMATMATLPIIIGLGTDFGVQFLNRYEEEFAHDHDGMQATTATITHTGPAVGTAVIVMALSFLTMLISRAPMMRNFGITLAMGVVICYVVELVLMFATLTVLDRRQLARGRVAKVAATNDSWLSRGLVRYGAWVTEHSLIIITLGVILGGIGFFFESRINVETDMMKMVPQDIPALKRTNRLSDMVGSTTNLTYLVSSPDTRDKAVLAKANTFGQQELHKYGHGKLQAVTSLGTTMHQNGSGQLKQTQVNATIKDMPQVMKSTLISNNHKFATISFKVNPHLDSDEMLHLMNRISNDAKQINKPSGMTIVAAGSQAMMLQGIDNMTANHELIIVVGLVIIALVLLLVYRNLRYALYPLVPIIIVLGLSPMTLAILGISYNPVTIALSSLVLGIGTEFTILILERYIEELRTGQSTIQAIETAMGSVGRAITVSGLTVIGGFSTLLFVHFPVLNSFGLITVLDTTYSLISALTILPAMMYAFRNRSLD
ncbi:efflux RND transporter permease subunit [Furfurilactobacillus curtus]|uniref:RND transporter n=1 Tax=Furfurilactobacillus curtus TaxID=1746200 RepID=A0ABQ5JP63_9LACO